MHVRRDPLAVELGDPLHRRLGKRRQLGRGGVRARLLGGLRPGDDRRDRVEAQDPPQRELGQRRPFGDERPQLVDDLEAELEVDARERLPDVELLAVPVEGPVVVGAKLVSRLNFPVSRPEASGTRTITPTSRRVPARRRARPAAGGRG